MIAEEKSKVDEDIQLFAEELKRCFSEEEIEEIASEIKVSEAVHEYIERLYFELIKFPCEIFNTLKLVFENIVKNGLKCHKKNKKTVFNILGIHYNRSSMRRKIVA